MPFRRFLHIVSKIAAVMKKSITYVQDELFSSHKITNLAELTLSEERRRLTDGEPAKLPGEGGREGGHSESPGNGCHMEEGALHVMDILANVMPFILISM
jgi:hypothetical protein